MCEFKVILNGETVFKDVVLAKVKGSSVSVKDVLGTVQRIQELQNTRSRRELYALSPIKPLRNGFRLEPDRLDGPHEEISSLSLPSFTLDFSYRLMQKINDQRQKAEKHWEGQSWKHASLSPTS